MPCHRWASVTDARAASMTTTRAISTATPGRGARNVDDNDDGGARARSTTHRCGGAWRPATRGALGARASPDCARHGGRRGRRPPSEARADLGSARARGAEAASLIASMYGAGAVVLGQTCNVTLLLGYDPALVWGGSMGDTTEVRLGGDASAAGRPCGVRAEDRMGFAKL